MKKILYLLLMSIIFGLYGCGSEDSNVSTPFEKQIVIFFDCTTNLADVKCSVTKEYVPDNMQILQYYWDFGDNKVAQGKDNGNHTYDVSGKYNISLKIQYEENGSPLIKEIGTKQINISIPDTDNGTTSPNEIEILFDCTTNLADVKCSITKEVVPDNMQILQYYWDFGDNKVAQGKDNGNHTYDVSGKYNISLKIQYEENGSPLIKEIGTKQINISIPDTDNGTTSPNEIEILFDCTTNLADVKCSITKEVVPDNMQILQYYWDFGDSKDAQGKDNGNHTYDVSGKYNISLKIQYEENGSPLIKEIGTKQINISIPDTDNGTTSPNEIEILFDCTTNLADVKCSITKEVVPDNMQILQYYWDFGDSKDAQGKDNGNHTYTSIGKYNIRLGILYELQDGATETKIMGIKSIEITQIPHQKLK